MDNQKFRYLKFDKFTGEIQSCQGGYIADGLAINEELGIDFVTGKEVMSNYKVIFVDNAYKLIKKYVIQKDSYNNTQSNDTVINKNIYKITTAVNDNNCILIRLNKKEKNLMFSVTEQFKDSMKDYFTENSSKDHYFFATKKNDGSILDNIFVIDMKELLEQGIINVSYDPKHSVDLYCRKTFDYKYEEINE
jgi:lipoprotein-anchoring transpeptidase ErfK/SrfK